MAIPTFSKPSKWLSKSFKLALHRHRRSDKPSMPNPPASSQRSRAHEFHEVFRRLDSDGDGRISSEELRSFFVFASDDVPTDEVERVMKDHDLDGNGFMDYDEFVKLMEMGRNEGEEEEDLRRAFEKFEVEKGSGCITPDGLQMVLRRLGEPRSHEECAAMISAYDLDGNGVLDYHEFLKMMT